MSKETKNKLVPELRFPEFISDQDWIEDSIGNVCETFSGGTPSTAQREFYGGSIAFIRSAEIDKDNTELFITDAGLKNSSAKLVNKGDILFALYGANSGEVALSKQDGAINQAVLCLRSKSSNVFIYHFLAHRKNWIVDKYIQGGQGNLSGEIVKSIKVPFPHLKEQQKIADCLSSLDNVITAQTEKFEALKEHKKGLMQQLFPAEGVKAVPRLRFKEFRESEEWEIIPLGDVAENLDFKRVPITESERTKGDIPYYGASGIIDYVKDFIFNEELLCISEDGANLVARTYPIAFSIKGKTWVNNHAHVLKFKNPSTQVLVENYLNYTNLQDYLTGMAQPKLNRSKLDIIPIPLPQLNEQQKIADCLSALDELITAQHEKIDALKEHKKGLMQNLFPNADEL